MRVSKSWVLAVAGILCFAWSSAQADPGDPGFFVRIIEVDGTIDNVEKHNNVLAQGPIELIWEGEYDVINFNGGGFADDNDWPDAFDSDFVTRAWADVTIPAGQWGVGWGSDDGGQLILPGVEFATSYEQNAGEYDPNGDIIGSDTLYFDGNRGYRVSYGSFSLDSDLDTQINVSMWERGGGDNIDVFFIDLEDTFGIEADELTDDAADRPQAGANGWELISNDSFQKSWNPRVPGNIPPLGIPVAPGQKISGIAEDVTKEEVGEVKPGLLHYWYGRGNAGSIEAAAAFYDIFAGPIDEPDVAPFNPENTWWTGNQAPIEGGTTDAPKYPVEIIDQPHGNGGTYNGNDNSNYTTALSGQIRFPADGTYTFTDGVDDLTALAIDGNQDGEFDPDTEILIHDNAWTNLQRDANNGGFTTNGGEYIPIEIDVPDDGNCDDVANAADGCWFNIEVLIGEGGGTDAGAIYWDANKDVEFPNPNGDGRQVDLADVSELLIPEENLRAPGGIVITGANLAATLNGEFPYQIEINEDGSHDSLEVNRTIDVATTSLDMNGATIDIFANGDLSGLEGELKLFTADSYSGELTVNLPEGVTADTSRLASEGVIVFGDAPAPGIAGDLDGDGTVGFPDFLLLSDAFGSAVDPPGSGADIDGDGTVGFPDFLVLSNNFGQSAAASVPEPASFALLGLGGLFLGLFRRRR